MPRPTLPLAFAAFLLLSPPLHADSAPAPEPCPEGEVLTEAGTCLATRGLGSKDSPPPTDSRTGDRGTRNLMGSAGSPDI
jgi:hypothetical protein